MGEGPNGRRPLVWVGCRFVRCEKFRFAPGGKSGRYYRLFFEVVESGPGGPPPGTPVVRVVWGDPEKLTYKDGQKLGLVATMQKLHPALHSPEQLLSENWAFTLRAGVREEVDQRTGLPSGWGMAVFEHPTSAVEVPPGETGNASGRPPGRVTADDAAAGDAF